MNDQAPARSSSVHLPLMLLLIALCVFFASQIGAADRNKETMLWQRENFDKQLTQIKEGQKSLTDLIEKRKEVVTQSQSVKEQYVALFNEVVELAKTDKDAAEVVQKWKIQVAAPPKEEAKDPAK